MNLMYYRKSKITQDQIVKNLHDLASRLGLEIKATTKIKNGTFIYATQTTWIEKLLEIDSQLIALTPATIVVLTENEGTKIGVANPALLSTIAPDPKVRELATTINDTVMQLIHKAGELGELKVKKVKLYSTTTCPYCKMEEAWLKENKVDYDLSLVDMNQKDAQYMVEKTGQMGVPVTEVVYEDADSEFVIGFDKPQLSKMLHLER